MRAARVVRARSIDLVLRSGTELVLGVWLPVAAVHPPSLNTQLEIACASAAEPKCRGKRDNPIQIADLRGDPGNKLDDCIHELGRLQDVAREMLKSFGNPKRSSKRWRRSTRASRTGARSGIRSPTEVTLPAWNHVAWFSSVARLTGFGGTEDPLTPSLWAARCSHGAGWRDRNLPRALSQRWPRLALADQAGSLPTSPPCRTLP